MKYDESEVDLLITMVIFFLGGAAIVIFKLMHALTKNRNLHLLEIKQLNTEHEKALRQARLEMQENTFQQISHELHDNIKLSLILSRLDMNALNNTTEMERKERVQSSIEHIENALKNLDDISRSLNSGRIRVLGLYDIFEQEIDKIRKTTSLNIDTHYSAGSAIIDQDREIVIVRIVQEVFNNSIRHSGAKKIIFSVDYLADHACFTITDDGKGFDYSENHAKTKGSGLYNIRLRAKALNARLHIDTAPGRGTTVSLKVPSDPNLVPSKTVKAIPQFNFLQRLMLCNAYRTKLIIDFLAFMICQYFLWERQLWWGLGVLTISLIMGFSLASRQDLPKLAGTMLGKAMLILANPLNVIFCTIGIITIYYGNWLNSYYVIAAGALIILISTQLTMKKERQKEKVRI